MNKCGGEQQFATESAILRNSVVAHVSGKPEYELFCNADMSAYKRPDGQANLYTRDNSGKAFISIDLVKANFEAMRWASPALVDETSSYVDFISQFTSHPHFIKSRQVRQYIFGNLNPKRQMIIARYLIGKVSEVIMNGFHEEKTVATSHDEVVITTNGKVTAETVERLLRENVPWIKVKVEEFFLERIGDHPFYMKTFEDQSFELKAVPEYFLPQVYKHVRGLPIDDMDMHFFFEGKVAKFVQPLEF